MKNPLNKKSAKLKQPKQNKPNLLSQLTSKKGNKPKSNTQKPATKKTGNGLLDKLRGKKTATNLPEQSQIPQASSQPAQHQTKAKKGLSLSFFGKNQPKAKSVHASPAIPTTPTTAKPTNNSLQQFLATKGRFLIFGIIVLIVLLLAYVLASKFVLNNDEQNVPISEPPVPVETTNVPADNDTANDIADDTATVISEDSAVNPSEITATAEAASDASVDTRTTEGDERHVETQSQISNALKGVTPSSGENNGSNISYHEFVKESKNKIYVEEGR